MTAARTLCAEARPVKRVGDGLQYLGVVVERASGRHERVVWSSVRLADTADEARGDAALALAAIYTRQEK